MSDVVDVPPRAGRVVRRAAVACVIVVAAVAPSAYLWSSARAANRALAEARAEAEAAKADARAARAQAGRPRADSGPDVTIPIPLAPLPPGEREVALDLRGAIKNRRNINGVEYATITLGSADHVVKGMRFKVIDRNNFLGYLTVDNVEPSESVGHLEGPQLAVVRPGTEVRTRW